MQVVADGSYRKCDEPARYGAFDNPRKSADCLGNVTRLDLPARRTGWQVTMKTIETWYCVHPSVS